MAAGRPTPDPASPRTLGQLVEQIFGSGVQQPFGVGVTDFAQVLRADRQRIQKVASGGIWDVRVVHGKEDPIRSDDLQSAQEGRYGEVSAGSEIEMLLEVFADAPFEMVCVARKDHFSSSDRERQVLTHMPDDDPQLGKAVE